LHQVSIDGAVNVINTTELVKCDIEVGVHGRP
jgi:hypothetical protein